jgi:hypothetical protein
LNKPESQYLTTRRPVQKKGWQKMKKNKKTALESAVLLEIFF